MLMLPAGPRGSWSGLERIIAGLQSGTSFSLQFGQRLSGRPGCTPGFLAWDAAAPELSDHTRQEHGLEDVQRKVLRRLLFPEL